MDNKTTVTLELNPNDSLITLNQRLIECSNAVFFGINAINQTKELPEYILSDINPSFQHVPFGNISFERSRSNFKSWILKKGFEDIIVALTELLISFSNIIDLNNKVKANPNYKLEDFLKSLMELNDQNSGSNFPKLIDKVNSSLMSPMKYKVEMETINRIRRCLVHRKGIVRPRDFNNKNNDAIELKWWYVQVYFINNGKRKLFNAPEIITKETKQEVQEVLRVKSFKENEEISISFQEFNELVFFCQTIGKDILNKFKLN